MALTAKAYEGLFADQQTSVRLSRLAEGAVNPGRIVTQGTNDNQIIQGGAGMVLGVALADRTLSPEKDGVYANGDSVVYVGHPAIVWCRVQETVTAGMSAAYDPATGELNQTGTAIPNAIYDSSAASGELVKLRLQ